MFETFKVPALFFANPCVASLRAVGRTSGLAMSMGGQTTYSMAVKDGKGLIETLSTIDMGGQDITASFLKYMINKYPEYGWISTYLAYQHLAHDMIKHTGYIALDYNAELLKPDHDVSSSYEDHCGSEYVLHHERFMHTEILFKPELYGIEKSGVHHMIYNSIKRCDLDIQNELFNNIVLSGGTSLTRGLDKRLIKELKVLSPQHADHVRIEADPPGLPRRNLSFVGAAMMAPTLTDWMTKAEYDENYHIRNGKIATPLNFIGWTSLLLSSHGFTSLYSGVLLMLLKVEAALWFGSWIKTRQRISPTKTDDNKYQQRSQSTISTFITKVLSFGLLYPLGTIITRVMASPDVSTLGVVSDAFSSSSGIISLYSGIGIGVASILAGGALSLVSDSIFSSITRRLFVNYPGRVRLGILRWIFGSLPLIGTYFMDTIMRELMLSDRTDVLGFEYARTAIDQRGISNLYGGCLFHLTFSAIQTFSFGFIDVVARFKFPR